MQLAMSECDDLSLRRWSRGWSGLALGKSFGAGTPGQVEKIITVDCALSIPSFARKTTLCTAQEHLRLSTAKF